MLLLPFLIISNTSIVRARPNTKNILIYGVDFVKGYNTNQYICGIQLCAILAKCWKLS